MFPNQLDIGNHTLVPTCLNRKHNRLAHSRELLELTFDLAQLDAEAADLYLGINPTHKLIGAIGQPPGEIAGTVEG